MAHPHNRHRLLSAAVLAGALALAGCTGADPAGPPAEAAPTTSWQPLMAPPSAEPAPCIMTAPAGVEARAAETEN